MIPICFNSRPEIAGVTYLSFSIVILTNELFLDALDDMSGVREYWAKQECNMAVSWDYAANLDFSEYPGYEGVAELSIYVLSIPDDKYMEYVAETTGNEEGNLDIFYLYFK